MRVIKIVNYYYYYYSFSHSDLRTGHSVVIYVGKMPKNISLIIDLINNNDNINNN